MKFRQKITLYLFITIVWVSVASAQPVHMPDPNLRAAIREALDIADRPEVQLDVSILRRHLRGLDAGDRGISDLTGLEHATSLTSLALPHNDISDLGALTPLVNLIFLRIHHNQINDLSPLANLTKLSTLLLDGNNITDLSPLSNLTQLTTLVLSYNNITNVSPLANLTQLNTLNLKNNTITDINPLANLINLERLELQDNQIADHSPVDNLSLTTFIYDETCDMPPLPLLPRLEARTYPSIFAPFDSSVNQPHLSWTERTAQHDLYFTELPFRHQWFNNANHWEVRGPNERSIRIRDELIALNPNMVFISEIRMRDAKPGYFPEDSPYWVRDSQGNIVDPSREYLLINFTHPDVQDMIVSQALAVARCGLYDGILFDWWNDGAPVLADHNVGWGEGYYGNEAEQRARDNIINRIRAQARRDFLILANTNDRAVSRTAAYINGATLEAVVPTTNESITRFRNSLHWLEKNLRTPRINSLQGGSNAEEPPDSPANLRLMRAFTTLSLTHSDGYVQFAIGSGNDHYWYDFWDADLGRPVGPKAQVYQETDGLYIREFTNGWAVYNHSGEPQVITLPEEAQGVASGRRNTEHALPNLDGEMYLRVAPKNPADVNEDGVVNIFDLTLVAQALSTGNGQGDVNGDGVINVFDLVMVAEALQ